MPRYDIVAATGCATGIAHTYMAQESLQKAATARHLTIKVETHGQGGVEDRLTPEEIASAQAVIVAADIDVQVERFAGKPVIMVPVTAGIREPNNLIDQALAPYAPIYLPRSGYVAENEQAEHPSLGRLLYTSLMNGVSHMLPLVVAGGVLMAVSMLFGIYAADPQSSQYNEFAAMLNQLGKLTMNMMIPVMTAYIAAAIGKRSGLTVGFAVGIVAQYNGASFIGGILGGYLAGAVVVLLQLALKPLPDHNFRGLKTIFLYPVLGTFIAGSITWIASAPLAGMNAALMTSLKGMQNASPIILGLIVGIMSASDFGGPINKAAYLTGTALLAQGNTLFMAGVSAACIAPPLATTVAVLLNGHAFTRDERSTGYVNLILGATHITEGAIPFAAKNPLLNIPAFMVGSSLAAIITYMAGVQVPAPHGGFIILPLVTHPFVWIIAILLGAVVSGVLLAITAELSLKRQLAVKPAMDAQTVARIQDYAAKADSSSDAMASDLGSILSMRDIVMDMQAESRDDVLRQLADMAEQHGLVTSADAIYARYRERDAVGPTGMAQGIAIPHAKDAAVLAPAMLIVRLKHPVTWPSLDDQPVDIIISFLIPDNTDDAHLQYLSSTAKLLTHQRFIDQLRRATTPLQVLALFKE